MKKALHLILIWSIVATVSPVAFCDPPAPAAVDAAIDQFMKLDPGAVAKQLKDLKVTAAAQEKESADLKTKADALAKQAGELQARVDGLVKNVTALSPILMKAPVPAPAAPAAAPAMAAPAAAPAMAAPAKATTNFDDHVKPIFQARCAKCHNDDTKKSGLSLAAFGGVIEGGSSGKVIVPGDPAGSRLFKLITKVEQPNMPPSGDPLTPDQIEVIRKWIAEGAVQNAAAPAMVKAAAAPAEEKKVFVAAVITDTTPPMPPATLAPATPLAGRGVVARAVDTNPRSPLMAVGGNRQVLFYNIESRALLGALPFPEGDIFTMTFSVSGEWLLAGGGKEGNSGIVVVWNVRTGERIGTYAKDYDTVLAADISPDQKMIAAGGPNKKVHVYAVDGGKELYKLDVHTDWITALKFTPDGELLASADRQGGLFLWQAANGRAVEQLKGHEGSVNALCFSQDSAVLLSAGQDGTVREWDTWKYTAIRNFKAHTLPVFNVAISKDNHVLTASADGTAKLFTLEGKEEKKFDGLADWGYQARFANNDGVVLAGSWTGDIVLWKKDTGELLAKLKTNPGAAEPPKS